MSEAIQTPEGTPDRPWLYQPQFDRSEIVDKICEQLAEGTFLAEICRAPGFPAPRTVQEWRDADELINAEIALARETGEERIAWDAIAIVDGKKPVDGVPPEAARDKARAEIRLKVLAKFNPKRWGDGIQLRHADADGQKLDTKPLVAELLTMVGGKLLRSTQQPDLIDVTPTRLDPPAKTYVPRAARHKPAPPPIDDLI